MRLARPRVVVVKKLYENGKVYRYPLRRGSHYLTRIHADDATLQSRDDVRFLILTQLNMKEELICYFGIKGKERNE